MKAHAKVTEEVVDRRVLRQLVSKLPANQIQRAVSILRSMEDPDPDPLETFLMNAPYDDEEETPEEAAAVAVAKKQLAEGKMLSEEEVRRNLGL